MNYKLPLIFALVCVLFSCKKEKVCDLKGQAPVIIQFCESDVKHPVAPVIEFVEILNIDSFPIPEFEGLLSLKLNFTDGDGDIGTLEDTTCNNGCITTCIVSKSYTIRWEDTRVSCSKFFGMKDSVTINSSIEGELFVTIFGLCCILPNGFACTIGPTAGFPLDTVTYLVQIKDRAGNLSNIVETPPIIIDCSF